jgi:6-phosphogluconolactonase
VAAETPRPSYLALNQVKVGGRERHLMYAVNVGDAQHSMVSTFELDVNSGALTPLGQVTAAGAGPCYIAVDATGGSAYVANFSGGTIASYKVLGDGTLSEPVDRVNFHDDKILGYHGPNAERQMGPHPHSSMLSPDNRFLIVNDLGNDDIAIFPIDPTTAHLGAPHLFESQVAGSGPRHVAFHPNGRWVYGINEMGSRIDQYLWTSAHASPGVQPEALLTDARHSVSTLDAAFHGTNTAAEIVVAPSGNFVYASNRGENSLVVFDVEPLTGSLTLSQRIGCGGKTPRHFTPDQTGNWLICGNQDSGSVTVFARNQRTGKLSGPTQSVEIESPMFALFV